MQTKRILRPRQIAEKIGCSVSHYYELVSRGEFPAPTKLSHNISGTLESTVDEWIDQKMKGVA